MSQASGDSYAQPTGGQFPELATSPYLVIFGAEKRMPLTPPPLYLLNRDTYRESETSFELLRTS